MNSIDFIIKHKLWTLAKQTNFHDLDQNIEYYVYNKANLDMLEDIKNNELLEKYFIRLINTEQEYKHEKKMFNYLLENMSYEKIQEIKSRYSDNYLLLQWTKRNTKNPHFEFLEILDKNILTDGTFLNYALDSSEKIIDYAIKINQSSICKLTEKIDNNLLLSQKIKGKLKIKLFKKFLHIVKQDVHQYLLKSIENNDELTALWLLTHFQKDLNKSSKKYYNFLRCSYNELMEKCADTYFDNIFDRENQMFVSVFFEKIITYKKQKNSNHISSIEQALDNFEKYNLTLNSHDSNSIFCKIVTIENIDFLLLPNNVLNIKKENICVESLLYKLLHNNNPEDKITNEKLKMAMEKIHQHDFLNFDRGSNALFLDYVNQDNIQWLFSHKLCKYNIEKLLPALYNKSKLLSVELAKLIDKKIVWSFLESLEKKDRVEFELYYYHDRFTEKEQVKRLKI